MRQPRQELRLKPKRGLRQKQPNALASKLLPALARQERKHTATLSKP
jgi:hypothetical protein